MATTLRERRRQLLRNEILQAAGALLNEKGYAAISMDELAGRVGISKPTLYSQFATKEDLIIAAVMYWFDRVEQIIASDQTPRTPLQQLCFILRTAVQLQIDEGALSPRPWAPEIFQIIRQRVEVLARLRQIDASVAALVQAGVECGEINPALDPAVVVRAYLTLVSTLHSPFAKLVKSINPSEQIGSDLHTPHLVGEMLALIFANGVRAPVQ